MIIMMWQGVRTEITPTYNSHGTHLDKLWESTTIRSSSENRWTASAFSIYVAVIFACSPLETLIETMHFNSHPSCVNCYGSHDPIRLGCRHVMYSSQLAKLYNCYNIWKVILLSFQREGVIVRYGVMWTSLPALLPFTVETRVRIVAELLWWY